LAAYLARSTATHRARSNTLFPNPLFPRPLACCRLLSCVSPGVSSHQTDKPALDGRDLVDSGQAGQGSFGCTRRTTTGEACVLPFTFAGMAPFTTCTAVEDPFGPWCATEVDAVGEMTAWEYCDCDATVEVPSQCGPGEFVADGTCYPGCDAAGGYAEVPATDTCPFPSCEIPFADAVGDLWLLPPPTPTTSSFLSCLT
jgi:hypothetical protein